MADKEQKVSENVPGKYYVDLNCISCGICENTAPEIFKIGSAYAFVYKQPGNLEEIENAEEAMTACPVDAIGDDGE